MNHRILLAAGALAAASIAVADSPHFIKATGTLNADGEYVASFKEAGLGNAGGSVTYSLTAGQGTQFTYQCYTKSNNAPQGAPNYVFPSDLSTVGSFPVGRNGQITASLTLTPSPEQDCQGNGLKLCLVAVNYQTVVLTDTTNGIAQNLPSRSESYIGANGRPTNCEPF